MNMLMADTDKTDKWIKGAMETCPCVILDNGQIQLPIARIQFAKIFERGKPQAGNDAGAFGCALIFPVGTDLSLAKGKVKEVTLAKWPTAGQKGGPKLTMPWKKVVD